MIVIDSPKYRIWVKGSPKSFRSRRGNSEYKKRIQDAAKEVVPSPITSNRIDIEVFFLAEVSLRADVDNILKPILDTLKGIVYDDDRQVRSVKATALPKGEAYGLSGLVDIDTITRFFKEDDEFLINVYCRFMTPGP